MVRHCKAVVFLFVLLLAFSALAQQKSGPAEPSPLQPVAWLVGGTWVSNVKGPDQKVTHVENKISWAPNHQAIEFLTRFNGKPHYNGFYAYDAGKKSIEFFYTSSEGDLTVGTVVPQPDGKTLQQNFDLTDAKGWRQRLLVHCLLAEKWRVVARVQDSLRAEVDHGLPGTICAGGYNQGSRL
jgi:hypothetical protein